jgi:DNA-directed RNA polymerase specialized sigma24 family protein
MALSSRLSGEAFEKLLQSMGPDRDAAGAAYEELRQRLLRFFRWEGCSNAEDCADDVFNRLSSKLLAGERILNPVAYAGGIARLVLKETNRRQAREQQQPLAGPVEIPVQPSFVRELEESGERAAVTQRCFENCLGELSADVREFLLDYYRGEASIRIRNRQRMANRLEISLNSLRNRALRLREKLEACVGRCCDGDGGA